MSEKIVEFSQKKRETIVKKDKSKQRTQQRIQRALRKDKKQYFNDTCKDYENGDRHGKIWKLYQRHSDLKRTASNRNAVRLFQKDFLKKDGRSILNFIQ